MISPDEDTKDLSELQSEEASELERLHYRIDTLEALLLPIPKRLSRIEKALSLDKLTETKERQKDATQ